MRIELWLLLICALVVFNIYTEGRYLKNWMRYKKWLQMAGVVLGTLFLYYLIKKNPMNTGALLQASNDYIKYMPLDKQSAGLLAPILDFTAKQQRGDGEARGGRGPAPYQEASTVHHSVNRVMDSGQRLRSGSRVTATKRSVSETKKKYVASRQGWRCHSCQEQLTAWFEVDHKVRLEYGGSNHVDNLVALCRNCHGQKTAMENMNKDML
jgi:HNH endonuclease